MKRRVKLYSSAAFLGNPHTRPSLGLNHPRAGAQGLQRTVTRSVDCSAAPAGVPLVCPPASFSHIWGRPPQSCVWTRPQASLSWIGGGGSGASFLLPTPSLEASSSPRSTRSGRVSPCPRSWSDSLLPVLAIAPGQRDKSLESSVWAVPDDHSYVS